MRARVSPPMTTSKPVAATQMRARVSPPMDLEAFLDCVSIFGPLSKNSTGMAALRAGSPVITDFGDFGGCKPTFYSDNGEIWREGTDLGHPPLCLIL